ncbi:MAG: hypothetical protein RLZZ543_77 [Bacteroidota bacterium]|jgi:hypothetical protein
MLNAELIERLKSHWSARGVEIIARECIHDPALFRDLVEIMLEGPPRAQQQSAWSVAKITDTHASLFHPYTRRLIDHILHPGHSSVTRNTLRIWMKDLPDESFHGEITDVCFTILMDRNQLPASRAFSMHVLGRLGLLYPDLWNELKSIIESGMPVEGPAFCSVGRNLLKKFSRRN